MVTYEHDIYHTGVTTNTFTFTQNTCTHRNAEHLEYIKKYIYFQVQALPSHLSPGGHLRHQSFDVSGGKIYFYIRFINYSIFNRKYKILRVFNL